MRMLSESVVVHPARDPLSRTRWTKLSAKTLSGPRYEESGCLGSLMAVSNEVPSNPFVSAETLKACALIGLHPLAAEGEAGSSGSQSPALGDMWRQGCPKSPEWISSCSASETSLGCEVYEHKNDCQAIEVIGQDWLSEVVAIFLEDWELWRVALSCHITMDFLCQETREACWDSSESLGAPCCVRSVRKVLLRQSERNGCLESQPSQQTKAFLSPWTAVTIKERDVVRENKEKKECERQA